MAADDIIEPKWTDELRIYGEGFVGRQTELAAMDQAWAEGARIFVLYAEGGAGKTRVVVEWLRQMRDAGWRGARRVFVYSFYSQGSDERRNASSDLFFEQALKYFGHQGEPITQSDEQGRALARLLVETNGLLVLDGLEPLQHPPLHAERGRLKDPGIARLLLSLANAAHDAQPGLCLITSRQPVVELQGRTGVTVRQQSLDHLHRDDGAELLRQFEVTGPEEELRIASDEFHGHAYSLMLLGSYLRNATDHKDIRRRREVVLLEEEAETEHYGHAHRMFAAYVRYLGEASPEVAVLRLLGFFDRAAEQELLKVLSAREGIVYEWSKEEEPADRRSQPTIIEDSLLQITAPLLNLSQTRWNRALNRLRALRLIDFAGSGLTPALEAHPLLHECFAEQVRTAFPEAWQAGHRRLFEHFSGTVPYWPEGIEGLQPLYHAVAHGCLAELQEQAREEVYRNRILRGGFFYSTRKLGAFGADLGAVACFFVKPWTTLSPNLQPADQAWLLNQAAIRLRALGRLAEAVESLRLAIKWAVEEQHWKEAAIGSGTLSELELTQGDISAAITAGEQSVTYADRSDDDFRKLTRRTVLADALQQAGRNEESHILFKDAESRQAALQPKYPRLYSLGGFRYSEFLLADAERATWLRVLAPSAEPPENLRVNYAAACTVVIERANELTLWRTQIDSLLDIALIDLTRARALLYNAHNLLAIQDSAFFHAAAALDGLRKSGDLCHLPRGLLTHAWLRHLSLDERGCREDLDEAWELAERGSMPLLQADILLTRARLFRDRTALAEARRLIEKHGYHRRNGELADAEKAARDWGSHTPSTSLPSHRSVAADRQEAPSTSSDRLVQDTKSEAPMRDQVFISYSHKDKRLQEDLLTHLKPFLRSGSVTAWSDKQIASGSKWFAEIQEALGKTKVAVLLVSPSFLASDFIHEHELGPLLKEAEAGGVKILWVQLRAASYGETPLKHYQAVVSPPAKPLAQMKAERDEAWVRICEEIKNAVNP